MKIIKLILLICLLSTFSGKAQTITTKELQLSKLTFKGDGLKLGASAYTKELSLDSLAKYIGLTSGSYGNLNLGNYKLVGGGGNNGITITNTGAVNIAKTLNINNQTITDEPLQVTSKNSSGTFVKVFSSSSYPQTSANWNFSSNVSNVRGDDSNYIRANGNGQTVDVTYTGLILDPNKTYKVKYIIDISRNSQGLPQGVVLNISAYMAGNSNTNTSSYSGEFLVNSENDENLAFAINGLTAGTFDLFFEIYELSDNTVNSTIAIKDKLGNINYTLNSSIDNTNLFIGKDAGLKSGGRNNTIIGNKALNRNNVGINNIILGDKAGFNLRFSDNNIIVGNGDSLSTVEYIQSSVIVGANTAKKGSYSSSVIIGDKALENNQNSTDNVAVGYRSMGQNTTGRYNVAIGSMASQSITSGINNVAVGNMSLYSNAVGNDNVTIGSNAGLNLSQYQNTFIGSDAGKYNTIGINNTMIGYGAGKQIITGKNNTIVGANITGLAIGLNNNIIIADGLGHRRINVDSLGRVGIGTNSPLYNLDVLGNIHASSNVTAQGFGGSTGVVGITIDNIGKVGIGTTTPTSKLQVTGGDVEMGTIGNGVIIKSPNGTRFRITISNAGDIISTSL